MEKAQPRISFDGIPYMLWLEIFQEVDVLNRLRLCRVSREWKRIASAVNLEKALYFDMSDLGRITKYGCENYPVGSAHRKEIDRRNIEKLYCAALFSGVFRNLFGGDPMRNRQGLSRLITPRTKVVRISFTQQQANGIAPDWTNAHSVSGWRHDAPTYLQVVRKVLQRNPSVTHVMLENFWLEGRFDLWASFRWIPDGNELYPLCRDDAFKSFVVKVALKDCYFILEARFWMNLQIKPPEPTSSIKRLMSYVPVDGCVYQPLPFMYRQFARSTDGVVTLLISDSAQAELDMREMLDKNSFPVSEELCIRIKDGVSKLCDIGRRIWTTQLTRLEPSMFPTDEDIHLEMVNWKSLRATTLHFFLSYVAPFAEEDRYSLLVPNRILLLYRACPIIQTTLALWYN